MGPRPASCLHLMAGAQALGSVPAENAVIRTQMRVGSAVFATRRAGRSVTAAARAGRSRRQANPVDGLSKCATSHGLGADEGPGLGVTAETYG